VFAIKDRATICAVTTRYRCTACGNLTRFDVTSSRRTKAFHHYSVGGDLAVEDEQVLDEQVESVECRWCGSGAHVAEISEAEAEAADATDAEAPAES
jgi:hypothetical protein